MPRYKYSAYNNSGVKQQGELEAQSEQEARKRISEDNLLLVEITEKSANQSSDIFTSDRLQLKDVEFFTSELALLLKSGLRIDKGLGILKQNVQRPVLLDFLNNVLNNLKQGKALSEVLEQYPVFGSLYTGLVKIAEETGDLTGVFSRLSQELKYQLDLNAKVKQALVYPSVILAVCVMALAFIFNFVVPNLTSLFHDQQTLPGYTVALLAVSSFMQNYQLYVLVVLVGLVVFIWHARHQPQMQQLFSAAREHLPVVSSSNLLVERIRFNAALATMLASGVAIDRALRLATNTLRTHSLRHEVTLAAEHVKRGQGLAKSLSETRLYPPYFAALLAIGEESGELAQVFHEIAERSRNIFYAWVTRFTNLLEPLLILFMGAVVGSIVVIMMLSISAVTDMSI